MKMAEHETHLATSAEVAKLSAMLGRAFLDDPVQLYLFPDEATRLKKVERLFGAFLRAHYVKQGATFSTSAHEGVALWAPPGHATFTPLEILSQAGPMLRSFGFGIQRALKVLDTIEKEHPTEPHWYLGVLGTDPIHQGKGIGASVLQPILDRCDREGVPAYLESSKDRNVPYYERFGFKVTKEIALPRGGPLVWAMWRDPQ
jgi:ribosomal protein S18 acetylase RimI-like enzyme